MSVRMLDSSMREFRDFFSSLLTRPAGPSNIDRKVAAIIRAVRRDGDHAVLGFSEKFDHVRLSSSGLRVSADELNKARRALTPSDRRALELAARRIAAFHRRTLERPFGYRDKLGISLGQLVRPLNRVGVYVPGGQGAYPSSVLMNAIPAKVAGVREIVMASPPSTDGDNPGVLAAAAIAGVDELYRVGGAQAIAALAFGTETIRPVDKIVGPGNAWVQAAKRMVYGVVDIDKMAGPSEICVIADGGANPEWVAADLIAQAEHGSGDESAILLTPSKRVAEKIAVALEDSLATLPRAAAVRRALKKRSALIIVRDLTEAFALANRIAPEHLELQIASPRKWLKKIESAGAVFLGSMSPAPLGDYIAGPNHVLPTGGSARFASPLGAYDFVKRTSIIESSLAGFLRLLPAAAGLARMEGFEGHARALEIRASGRGKTDRRVEYDGRRPR